MSIKYTIKKFQVMKNIKITIAIGLMTIISMTACENWLDLYPENAQVTDQFWKTKEDVESVVAAGYVKLRSAVDLLFVWGEIRGNGIEILNTKDDEVKAAQKLRDMDILPSNSYAKWETIYQIINMANSVIKFGPGVVDRDDSMTESEMNSLLSEAYFLRSLAYFYLIRTFRDVPFITEPYVDDATQYEIEKTSADIIIEQIVKDLNSALPAAKEFFSEVDNENPMNTKGRATKWAIYSLLADIYLWQGNYDDCIAACDNVIESNRVGLISNWFANYFPGNSNESIFEIQYSYSKGQTNDFASWFDVSPKYVASLPTVALFTNTTNLGDKRGLNGSFISTNIALWKYMGLDYYDVSTAKRSSTQNDQNFIIYRLADILLMKAEALTMQGNYEPATDILDKIRKRAGIEGKLNPASSEFDMLKMVMDERRREFVGEGKNWFDLLRMAKRNNYKYKDYLIQQVISVIPLNNVAIVSSKLLNTDAHYLPIHQDELNANRLLEQNPYYSSLGN